MKGSQKVNYRLQILKWFIKSSVRIIWWHSMTLNQFYKHCSPHEEWNTYTTELVSLLSTDTSQCHFFFNCGITAVSFFSLVLNLWLSIECFGILIKWEFLGVKSVGYTNTFLLNCYKNFQVARVVWSHALSGYSQKILLRRHGYLFLMALCSIHFHQLTVNFRC
jgi:hypothetical protein